MNKLIAIEDLAHDLGLLNEDVESWVKLDKITIRSDYRGRPAVEEQIKDNFAERQDYSFALKKSIDSDKYQRNISLIQAEDFKKRRIALSDQYEILIKELQKMHHDHLNAVNKHLEESAIRAAYLLFTKAISCLKMGCDNLVAGYWFTGSVMREIDETIDLAKYFILTQDTDQGKKDIKKWFRQNYTPKHSKCREAIAKHMSLQANDVENNLFLMNELYHKKSKWVHPTFGAIREVTEFECSKVIHIKANMYGVSFNEPKLYELTDFYKSSIWSAFQSFRICFSKELPLNENTQNRLVEIDKHFISWD